MKSAWSKTGRLSVPGSLALQVVELGVHGIGHLHGVGVLRLVDDAGQAGLAVGAADGRGRRVGQFDRGDILSWTGVARRAWRPARRVAPRYPCPRGATRCRTCGPVPELPAAVPPVVGAWPAVLPVPVLPELPVLPALPVLPLPVVLPALPVLLPLLLAPPALAAGAVVACQDATGAGRRRRPPCRPWRRRAPRCSGRRPPARSPALRGCAGRAGRAGARAHPRRHLHADDDFAQIVHRIEFVADDHRHTLPARHDGAGGEGDVVGLEHAGHLCARSGPSRPAS